MSTDVAFALRTARRSPGFVFTAVCTLAIGIGANTAIFSVISGVLIRPLPFPDADRLVQVTQLEGSSQPVFLNGLKALTERYAPFENVTAWSSTSKRLDFSDPIRIQAVRSDRSLFRMLGARPLLGRTFEDSDPLDVAVVSGALWRDRFGSDPELCGKRIVLDGDGYTVIGIMPASFQFPYRATSTEVWIPWTPNTSARAARVDQVTARLKPGYSPGALEKQWRGIAGKEARITRLKEFVAGRSRGSLYALMGAVGLVLLIACANIASLLLARGIGRTHEIAIRMALGANRLRIVRQLMTESVLLGLIGGGAGLILAILLERSILRFGAPVIPRASEIGIDWRVLLFSAAASLTAAIVFGIVPALVSSRVGKGMSPGRSRLRDLVAASQIGLALILLLSAGLLFEAFLRLERVSPGFAVEKILTARLSAPLRDHPGPGAYGRYLDSLAKRVQALPAVKSAGFISYLPLQNWGWGATFQIRGREVPPERAPATELRYVTPGYFATMRIPLLRGRTFTERDDEHAPVVIVVNESFARRYFPAEDPVGKRTNRGDIIGVIADVRESALDRPAAPEIYYSFRQNPAILPEAGLSMVVATDVDAVLSSALRRAIHELNPREVLYDVKPMERVLANSLGDLRLYLGLIGAFAAISVSLSALGVYGVMAFVVSSRTREFAVRIALGAQRRSVLGLVLRYGAVIASIGLGIGAAGTFGASRVIETLPLHGGSVDVPRLAGAGLALALIALAASVIPARRAMRVEPLTALRHE